jgi:hypothetical protein
MVAAAIIGGAVVAGAATTASGAMASSATNNATNAAVNEQNSALSQQATLSAPYRGLGTTALPQYEALLGIGKGANSATTLAALQNTPGYQFTQQQGQQGIENAASAQGGISGNTLTALDQYNTGLADQTYQNAVGNAQGAVGMGQAAAAGQASNIGTAAGNIGSALINQGNTNAGIYANEAAGLSKIAGNTTNQFTTLAALQEQTGGGQTGGNAAYISGTPYGSGGNSGVYCDYHLKEQLEYIAHDRQSLLPVYDFWYIGQSHEEPKTRGYIAQDVLEAYPEAVGRGPRGFLTVDHSKIDSEHAYPLVLTEQAWANLDRSAHHGL